MAKIGGLIDKTRNEGLEVLYVDAGLALFSREAPSSLEQKQQEKKARTMATILSKLRVASVAHSGESTEFALPFQERNSLRVFDWKGRPLAVLSAEDARELPALAQTARRKGAAWVLALVKAPFEALDRETSLLRDIDVVVATKGEELSFEDNRLRPGTPTLVQLQSRGRSLLRVTLHSGGKGAHRFALKKSPQENQRTMEALDERMAFLRREIDAPSLSNEAKALRQAKLLELQQRRDSLAQRSLDQPSEGDVMSVDILPIESTLPDSKSVSALISSYQREVADENLAHAEDECVTAESAISYVGNEACRACHGAAFDVWKKSKHASAYQTLKATNRQYDYDCVGCHVTGYRQLGGVCRIDRVFERDFVGCESCHGPGGAHVQEPGKGTMHTSSWPTLCQTCHNAENSPHFDFARYLPEILGPGHGQATRLSPQ